MAPDQDNRQTYRKPEVITYTEDELRRQFPEIYAELSACSFPDTWCPTPNHD